jgi:hypothetical protein
MLLCQFCNIFCPIFPIAFLSALLESDIQVAAGTGNGSDFLDERTVRGHTAADLRNGAVIVLKTLDFFNGTPSHQKQNSCCFCGQIIVKCLLGSCLSKRLRTKN